MDQPVELESHLRQDDFARAGENEWYMAEDRAKLDKYVHFDEPSDHVVCVHPEQDSGTTCGSDERQEQESKEKQRTQYRE